MPFINTKTTVSLSKSKKDSLTAEICRITRECLGKGENWVMTGFEDNASLFFQGDSAAVAYVEVKSFGTPSALRRTFHSCRPHLRGILPDRQLGLERKQLLTSAGAKRDEPLTAPPKEILSPQAALTVVRPVFNISALFSAHPKFRRNF